MVIDSFNFRYVENKKVEESRNEKLKIYEGSYEKYLS